MTANIIFPAINFTKAGIYTYTVREITPPASNWKIDKREYTITVTVTDDGAGHLKAKVDYPDGKIVFTNEFCKCYCKPTRPQADVCKCFKNLPFPMFLFMPLQKAEFTELIQKNQDFFEHWESILSYLDSSSSKCNCNYCDDDKD